jgi:ABC-type transport system substrate-binding protein
MHRKVWFLAAAALAVIAVVGSASAMAGGATRAASRMPALPAMFASYPKTPAARAHASVLNIAQEQDLPTGCTWNFLAQGCNKAWSIWVGVNPILRGPYVISLGKSGKYVYKYDLASKVVANSQYIRYTIRKGAKWNWGGQTSPVTWQDFVYSVEMLNAPGNTVAGNTGVNQIGSFTHSGNTVTFYWKKNGQKALGGNASTDNCNPADGNACGPFADYKDTIGVVMPYAATHTLDFNTQLFKNCICGSDGKYITDGPYYMSKYVHGQGTTLKANPKGWYGKAALTKTLNFTDVSDTQSEVNEIKGGEVDIADPQPAPALAQLRSDGAIYYKVTAGNYLEHVDISEGNGYSDNPLLKQAWFRQAIMMGINRQGLINAALPGVFPHGSVTPLNSILVFQNDSRYKAPFKKWDWASTGKGKGTIKMMKAHGCTGGPSAPVNSGNTHYWTCGGHQAAFEFLYANDNQRRVNSALVIASNLQQVGIKVNLVGKDGNTTGEFWNEALDPSQYDLTEFAWGGSVDPSGFISIWGCGATDNTGDSCNHAADTAFNASLSQLNIAARSKDIEKADKLYASSVPAIPLYALPDVLTYKKTTTGEVSNPAAGFTWNAEDWKWK